MYKASCAVASVSRCSWNARRFFAHKLKLKLICWTMSIMFRTSGIRHACTIQRFSWWARQCVYWAWDTTRLIRVCTPLLTPFMLAAPSYPCPGIVCISKPQSPSASRNFVANASPVVPVSASTNVKKSSRSSSFSSCVLRYLCCAQPFNRLFSAVQDNHTVRYPDFYPANQFKCASQLFTFLQGNNQCCLVNGMLLNSYLAGNPYSLMPLASGSHWFNRSRIISGEMSLADVFWANVRIVYFQFVILPFTVDCGGFACMITLYYTSSTSTRILFNKKRH